jgi:hypothetical protein
MYHNLFKKGLGGGGEEEVEGRRRRKKIYFFAVNDKRVGCLREGGIHYDEPLSLTSARGLFPQFPYGRRGRGGGASAEQEGKSGEL